MRIAPHDDRPDLIAGELGVELPAFEGPLVAFRPGEESGAGAPAYLGGDLHAVHPEAGDAPADTGRDPLLDGATITLDDHERERLEATAVAGIWCLAIPADRDHSAPQFTLRDANGRLRIWLLLPPARAMIGIAHFWLSSVPPSPGGRGAGGADSRAGERSSDGSRRRPRHRRDGVAA